MGNLANVLHVRPWEYDLLSVWEFYGLCNSIDKTEAANG